jgi:hypothetical protein
VATPPGVRGTEHERGHAMADPASSPGTGDDPGVRYERESTGVPRWVKVVRIVVAILVLLVVVMMLTGGVGKHNPMRHGGEGADAAPVSVAESRHAPPAGLHG